MGDRGTVLQTVTLENKFLQCNGSMTRRASTRRAAALGGPPGRFRGFSVVFS